MTFSTDLSAFDYELAILGEIRFAKSRVLG